VEEHPKGLKQAGVSNLLKAKCQDNEKLVRREAKLALKGN